MSLSFRNSRKHRINKRIARTRKIKTYSRIRISKQKGGVSRITELNFSYDNGKIQINNGQDLTNEWAIGNGKLKEPPNITIINSVNSVNSVSWEEKDKKYLITMTDPDAPNGQGQTGNNIWTHWVVTMQNGSIDKVIVPYQQPSPPRGIHRYEIKVYDVSMITHLPPTIKGNGNKERSTYYNNLLTFLQGKNEIGYIMYKINSNKE
jgi:phosphatidylethanolamine-binding protein (PEBP) family uncharacterized protein